MISSRLRSDFLAGFRHGLGEARAASGDFLLVLYYTVGLGSALGAFLALR